MVDAPIHRFSTNLRAACNSSRGPALDASSPTRSACPTDRRRSGSSSLRLLDQSGVIVAIDHARRRVHSAGSVLGRHHASYPYLVRHRGEVYCVPQTRRRDGIRCFRAVRYPTEWEDAAVLLLPGVRRGPRPSSSTPVAGGLRTRTLLRRSPISSVVGRRPLRQLAPARRQPVKIDARSARPAGTPFRHAATRSIARPRIARVSYGSAVAICRVDVLTPLEFREELVPRGRLAARSVPRRHTHARRHRRADPRGRAAVLLHARRLASPPVREFNKLRSRPSTVVSHHLLQRELGPRPLGAVHPKPFTPRTVAAPDRESRPEARRWRRPARLHP